jgi:hypothetical protein
VFLRQQEQEVLEVVRHPGESTPELVRRAGVQWQDVCHWDALDGSLVHSARHCDEAADKGTPDALREHDNSSGKSWHRRERIAKDTYDPLLREGYRLQGCPCGHPAGITSLRHEPV